MPFAFLMTDAMSRREKRDKELGRTAGYIKSRDDREMWYAASAALSLVGIIVTNFGPFSLTSPVQWVATVVLGAIFILSAWKFFKSVHG